MTLITYYIVLYIILYIILLFCWVTNTCIDISISLLNIDWCILEFKVIENILAIRGTKFSEIHLKNVKCCPLESILGLARSSFVFFFGLSCQIYIIFSDGVWPDCSRCSYGATVTSHYCDVTEAEANKPSREGRRGRDGRGEGGKGMVERGRGGEGKGADKPSRSGATWRLVISIEGGVYSNKYKCSTDQELTSHAAGRHCASPAAERRQPG